MTFKVFQNLEKGCTQTRQSNNAETINHLKLCDHLQRSNFVSYFKSSQTRRKQEEPEPEKDVDFFVDDVEREDANAVKLLNASGGSKLVKSALGDLGTGGYNGVHRKDKRGTFGKTRAMGSVLWSFSISVMAKT